MAATDKQQAEELMNDLLEFAKIMLVSHGEFHPFGGYLNSKGVITQVGMDTGGSSDSSDKERAQLLRAHLAEIAKSPGTTAVGVAMNVTLRAGAHELRDAVEIDLEHRSGYSAAVFFRYRVGRDDAVEIVDVTAQAGTPGQFFS